MWELEVLAVLNGGRKTFPPFKRGGAQNFYPALKGEGKVVTYFI